MRGAGANPHPSSGKGSDGGSVVAVGRRDVAAIAVRGKDPSATESVPREAVGRERVRVKKNAIQPCFWLGRGLLAQLIGQKRGKVHRRKLTAAGDGAVGGQGLSGNL